MKTFSLPPGFHVELVASEPMIESPILIDFDPDGRLWVLEMLAFLPDTSGRDSREPINRVVVLEDTERRRPDGQAHRLRRQAADAARAEGARPRRARRRAAEPLADEGHQRRPRRRTRKSSVSQHVRQSERGHRAQREQPVLGDGQRHVLVRAHAGTCASRTASSSRCRRSAAASGRSRRTTRAASTGTSTTRRSSSTTRRRGISCAIRTSRARAGCTSCSSSRWTRRSIRCGTTAASIAAIAIPFFRADGSSIVIQGAGTPTIYRGDSYPKDLLGQRVHHRFADESRPPVDRDRRRHGQADGEERLRARRVPRLVR